jgi:hypothetical protein
MQPFKPHNLSDMQQVRDVASNIFQNIEVMPDDFEMYPFLIADYASLCVGCTDPRALNYDETAEIDDDSCV